MIVRANGHGVLVGTTRKGLNISSQIGKRDDLVHKAFIGTIDGPVCVQIADMNDDGLNDVVAAAYDANAIKWYENSLWNSSSIDVIYRPSFHKVSDLDQDGDLDVWPPLLDLKQSSGIKIHLVDG